MNKKPKQLSFWKKIRFKYKLTFLNENSLEEVFSLKISQLSGILILAGFIVLLVSLTAIVIINTPIRNYLPGYSNSEIRKNLVDNALKVDSLEQILATQTLYLNNINALLRGDSLVVENQEIDTLTINTNELNLEKSAETTAFLQAYEEQEKYNLNVLNSTQVLPDNLIFYRPAQGIVSEHFDTKIKHFGVDIATGLNESVLATMKGTVIFAGFDANSGYVLGIQHPNGFVSIYKHNALLLKEEDDAVSAGEAIALVGNTGKLSTGTHLHFELWYKGKPINPEEFIVF